MMSTASLTNILGVVAILVACAVGSTINVVASLGRDVGALLAWVLGAG